MKNQQTQNRELSSITREENDALDASLATLNRKLTTGNKEEWVASAMGAIAISMYRVVYPRTKAQKRHFAGRQVRVVASIKLGA